MKSELYLLDTNICVFFLRKKYDIDIQLRTTGLDRCFISEITVAELLYGAECSNNPTSNKKLIYSFCDMLQVIPIRDALEEFAVQKTRLRKEGKPIDDFDLLIGSTAISNGLTLVTDNQKHFDRLPKLKIINWVVREL